MTICEGCGVTLNPVYAAMDNIPICMACIRARAKTATTGGRCKCGKAKVPGAVISTGGIVINGTRRGGRSWVPCRRCLGVIKAVA